MVLTVTEQSGPTPGVLWYKVTFTKQNFLYFTLERCPCISVQARRPPCVSVQSQALIQSEFYGSVPDTYYISREQLEMPPLTIIDAG